MQRELGHAHGVYHINSRRILSALENINHYLVTMFWPVELLLPVINTPFVHIIWHIKSTKQVSFLPQFISLYFCFAFYLYIS